MQAFLDRFMALPAGYSEGHYGGRHYGVSVSSSADGRRRKLYAEELGGKDHVSLNLYFLASGKPLLKPCEMPQARVIDFVMGFKPAP
ncbi:MAG: hypothetical protein JJ926_11795 [Roseitalea sp.]|nr:hypothetical protein [Roseitalea sp.]MBO6952558.1 hypothetical protein [Rhizobiaceae bacterium]MBO6592956.1 hypothetical protein [Roseitalea sp.]MBO6600302.1 hypothetical protein [Roseitalea sp.]MBO6613287.1 hypothetical protein [Roseitalea sp.]